MRVRDSGACVEQEMIFVLTRRESNDNSIVFEADPDEWEFDPGVPLSLPSPDSSEVHNDDFAQALAALPSPFSRPRPMPPSPVSPAALERFCQAVSALPPPKFSYRTHFKQSYTICELLSVAGALTLIPIQ